MAAGRVEEAAGQESTDKTAGLKLEGVTKRFGDTVAARDVSFDVASTETVAILGPSGCGKTTVLHLVAGLEAPDRGRIRWMGQDLAGVPAHRRGFGLMFQDFALFPHMSVHANVAFGLRMAGQPAPERSARVAEVLELVGLSGFGDRDATTLSGGEQQRVALARALAPHPGLLMLDEPLGSLDRTLRERLMVELRHILDATGQTALYVTHDQQEAFAVADRVVLMRAGEVAQVGTPEALYRAPASPFAARFLGLTNLLTGPVSRADGQAAVHTQAGSILLPAAAQSLGDGVEATVLLRPDRVRLASGPADLDATVTDRSFRGSEYHLTVRAGEVELRFVFPSRLEMPEAGASVTLGYDPDEAVEVLEAS